MNQYDLGALAAALFTAWLGPKLGPVIGIYSVILIAAVIGAGFALVRRAPDARPHPVGFVALIVGATCIVTVPITMVAVSYLPLLTAQVAAPLMALLIAAIGQDWPGVPGWLLDFRRKWRGGGGADAPASGAPNGQQQGGQQP